MKHFHSPNSIVSFKQSISFTSQLLQIMEIKKTKNSNDYLEIKNQAMGIYDMKEKKINKSNIQITKYQSCV